VGRFLNSIYFKLILAGSLAILPAGGLILYHDYQRLNRLLDQQLQEQFRFLGTEILSAVQLPNSMNEPFDREAHRVLAGFNSASGAAQMVQAGLYKRTDEEGVYRLAQTVQLDKSASIGILATNVFKSDEFHVMRQVDRTRAFYAIPVPSARSPDYVLMLQSKDETRAAYLMSAVLRNALFWSLTFVALLIFIGFVIHSEVRIPMRHLLNALNQRRKTALDPSDFGEFGDLVLSLEEIRHRADPSAGEQFVDPDTEFPTEAAAQKLFEDAVQAKDETFAVFLKVNYAKEYVKQFGRANRPMIKKIAAESLQAALPQTAPRAVTEDFYFICALAPGEFKASVERAQRKFNEDILRLYELGQGKHVAIQTLSAFAVSGHAPSMEDFGRALEFVEAQWEAAVDPRRGGWAILNADGQLEGKSGPLAISPAAPKRPVSAAAPAAGPPGEDARAAAPGEPMDAALARKMFIVKLCRLAGVKPRLAAQVYSAGWHRPDLLLQTKIQDLSTRAGVGAEEASELIANLRKHPKEKLSYETEDYREVFITDVRMIRKIPREALARWFEAGYRRIEDLRRASPDELVGVDGTVSREDIDSVLVGVRGAATR